MIEPIIPHRVACQYAPLAQPLSSLGQLVCSAPSHDLSSPLQSHPYRQIPKRHSIHFSMV